MPLESDATLLQIKNVSDLCVVSQLQKLPTF